MEIFGFLVVALVGVGLYMLPSFVAAKRKCRSSSGVVILNLLLGWTILGWIVALIWAVVGEAREA